MPSTRPSSQCPPRTGYSPRSAPRCWSYRQRVPAVPTPTSSHPTTRAFLDALDTTEQPVPAENRVLAALGPKMLELSATRAGGAHPYLVTPDHTRQARTVLGAGPLLLPEQTVLLTDDHDEARAIGTDWLRAYLALPNYANNLLRCGFTQDDLASVSNRLFDAIIAWGDEDAIVRRVDEHKQAGADHVCVQVLTADPREFPREQWRRLAAALT